MAHVTLFVPPVWSGLSVPLGPTAGWLRSDPGAGQGESARGLLLIAQARGEAALDIPAANSLAHVLHSPFASADHLARMVFIHPAGRHFCTGWTSTARATAAHRRRPPA